MLVPKIRRELSASFTEMIRYPGAIADEFSGIVTAGTGLLIRVCLPESQYLPGLARVWGRPLYDPIGNMGRQIDVRASLEIDWSTPRDIRRWTCVG